MSLIRELQRRKVFRVAGAYLVVAWLVIQVASTVAPQLNLPEWAPRLITLVTLLGFPVALVLAWVFEVTPEGVRRDPAPAGTTRVLAAAAVLAALAFAWYLRPSAGGGEVPDDERSIAVLPFVNMSGDPENEYFSDGISEEILNALAQMEGLKVAARTSSFSFKGHQREIPDIARELEVRMVLEGSVRKQGERVRVTAQLIDADRGFHVWSQTYDRELKDIFAIQDEIARAIADQLELELGGRQRGASGGTDDLEAYELYLKGIALWQQRGEANIRESERLFRAALERDRGFAKAWAGVALAWLVIPEWSREPLEPSWRIARDAAEHAAALDPSLPEPAAVLGYIAAGENRFETARALFARSLALAPSYATAWQWYSEALGFEGAREEALAASREAARLDPKALIMRQVLAFQLLSLGRYAEALEACAVVLREIPTWPNCHRVRFRVGMRGDDWASAREGLRGVLLRADPASRALGERMIDASEGKAPMRAVADEVARGGGPDAAEGVAPVLAGYDRFVWLAHSGHLEQAVGQLRLIAAKLPYRARSMAFDPAFAALNCLDSFRALLGPMGVPAAHFDAACAASKGAR